jgi:ureidoacrylate peracid hydrolase
MSRVDVTDWITRNGLFRFEAIDPRRTALLVIDLQQGLVSPGGPFTVPGALDTLPNVVALADALRHAGGTVVFTRHSFTDAGPQAIPAWQRAAPALAAMSEIFRPGLDGHAVDPRLPVSPSDLVIDKYRFSALARHSSSLAEVLLEREIDTVIVAGVVTNCCCESTARDASMQGWRTFVASDANAAMSDEEHEAALINLARSFADVRPTDSIIGLIEAGQSKGWQAGSREASDGSNSHS